MPDDLRWSWCNDNTNKVRNKLNVLESAQHRLPLPSLWKNCLPWNQSLMCKRFPTAASEHSWFSAVGVKLNEQTERNNSIIQYQLEEINWRKSQEPSKTFHVWTQMVMGLALPGRSDFNSKSDLQNEDSLCLIVGVYSVTEQKNILLPLEETQHWYTDKHCSHGALWATSCHSGEGAGLPCCKNWNLNMHYLWAENGQTQTPPWITDIYKIVFVHIKRRCVPHSFHHDSCRKDWWLLSFSVATDTKPLSSFPVRIFAPTVASFCSESWTWLTSSPCVCNKHIFRSSPVLWSLPEPRLEAPFPRIKPQHSLFKRQFGTGWYISDIGQLIQLAVVQKPIKHCKAIILQLKTN